MAFDEVLATRVRPLFARKKGVSEMKMFGGLGFLLNGNMSVGVWKKYLILRIGREKYDDTLKQPFVKKFDITGRPMTGWVMIEPEVLEDEQDLKDWVQTAVKFCRSLPAK